MASSTSTELTLKLLIDTKHEKVLFAEASKEVVDFLFNLLCLPIGTVVRLLTKKGMVGCLGNLFESVENLNQTYMQPNHLNKDFLLKPRTFISSTEISTLLPANDCNVDEKLETWKFYTCQDQRYCRTRCVTTDSNTICPDCNKSMNQELRFIGKKASELVKHSSNSGFVKEVITYMVMDDLVVQPMSCISSITLLKKFNVTEIGALEERVVNLGMTEGINLLKYSLQSKMVLTNVFLKNMGSEGPKEDYLL